MRIITFLLSALLAMNYGLAFAIGSDELPLGYYTPEDPGDADQRDSLRSLLGANVVTLGYDSNVGNIRNMFGDSIMVIPNLAVMTGLWNRYTSSCYSIWQAEDQTSKIRFISRSGQDTTIGDDTFWIAPSWTDTTVTDSVFLDNLWYRQTHQKDTSGDPLLFRPVLRIWADVDSSLADSVLGYLRLYEVEAWWDTSSWHQFFLDSLPIEANMFLDSSLIEYDFGDYEKDENGSVINYQISTTGKCSLMVDYLKISNSYGRDFMAGLYNSRIQDTVSQERNHPDSGLFAWEFRDEPTPDMFLPYRYADSLIREATYDEFGDTLFGMSAYSWGVCTQRGKSFLDIVGPKVWAVDLYSFYDDACTRGTRYTGNDMTGSYRGLQNALQSHLIDWLEKTRQYADTASIDWWFIAQSFAGSDANCEGMIWRWPTPSELSCETFVGLCYRPDGLVYWKHGWWWNSVSGEGTCGLFDTTGALIEPLYNKLEDDIVPYIKAIDATYLQLAWNDAYSVDPEETFPSGKWISSINTWSHPDSMDDNPDLGWFHVGEFNNLGSLNERYVMLVNRACSQGPEDTTAAPSVTATVKFNPINLGLGNYVYVIDIATGTDSADWVGTPDTTYSATLDGTIPFTTILGPGEGRLFKIMGTSEYRPLDSIKTSWNYSGLLRPTGDITVDSAETLTIYGPAEFRFSCSDGAKGGVDTKRPELILDRYSQLFAYGRESDSVLFTFLNGFCPSAPSITDWYGIRLACGGDYYFDYCRISDVINGITVEFPNSFRLLHTNVRDFDSTGVSLYGTHYDSTFIDNCLFIKGGYGILSDYGSVDVDSCAIDSVDHYGIKLSKDASAPTCNCSGYSADTYVTLTSSGNSIDHAGYGIAVLGQSGATPYPTLTSNGDSLTNIDNDGIKLSYASSSSVIKEEWAYRIRENFHNLACGISLYASSPTITGGPGGPACSTYFEIITADLGIDCKGGSNPSITRCSIFADTCVRADSNSRPNLHRRKNNLDGLSYEVYNNNSSTILAQANWWDGGATIYGPVDTSMAAEDPYCGPMPKREPTPLLELPVDYSLDQNFPNPFNPATSINFDLPEPGYVEVSIYNILGQRVRTLLDGYWPAGSHSVRWDGINDNGNPASSGVYFYLIQSGEYRDSKKMLLLR